MDILALSDIHGEFEVLDWVVDNIDKNTYDLVSITGDIWEGTGEYGKLEFERFQKAIKKPIVMIQGNHDFWNSGIFDDCKDIHLLHNEYLTLDGVKFFGTPFTPIFCSWNWLMNEDDLYDMWYKCVDCDIDVFLSHTGPRGFCDNCNQPVYGNDENSHLGSSALREIILERNPKYVFCGHIHTGDRHAIMPNGTNVYNNSVLDESYNFLGFNPPPKVIELDI